AMGSRKGKGRRPDHPLKQELGRDAGLEGQLAEGLPVHRAADAPEFPSAEVPDRTIVASSRTMVRLVHLMRPYRTIVCRAGFHCAIGALYRPQPHKKHLFTGGRAVGDRDDPKGAPRPESRAPGHPPRRRRRLTREARLLRRRRPPPAGERSEPADPAPKAPTPPRRDSRRRRRPIPSRARSDSGSWIGALARLTPSASPPPAPASPRAERGGTHRSAP